MLQENKYFVNAFYHGNSWKSFTKNGVKSNEKVTEYEMNNSKKKTATFCCLLGEGIFTMGYSKKIYNVLGGLQVL